MTTEPSSIIFELILAIPVLRFYGRIVSGFNHLGGRFGYFLFFSARGRGRGSPRHRGGWGDDFLLKIPAGGVSRAGGGGGEGPGGCLREIWGGGGGLNIFFGAEIPSKS